MKCPDFLLQDFYPVEQCVPQEVLSVGFLSCRTMCPIGSFVGRIFILQNNVSHRKFCFVGRIFILQNKVSQRKFCRQDFYPLSCMQNIVSPRKFWLQDFLSFVLCPLELLDVCKIVCNTVASFVAMTFCLLGGCFDVGRFVPLVVVLAQDVFSPWLSFWRWTFCPLDGRFSV